MLFLRYPLKRWWKVRVERVGIPMLTAIPLLTLPQFILLQYVKEKTENWPTLSAYEKYNTLAWELISHLWFLLVLVILTTVSIGIFTVPKKAGNKQASSRRYFTGQTFAYFFLLGIAYAAIRRIIFIVYPAILSDGMFNFIVMQTLFMCHFYSRRVGLHSPRSESALHHALTRMHFRRCRCFYRVSAESTLWERRRWMYETESVITMVMGLWMVNVVFSLGHRLLNFQSARVTYFVNASLFIYLVHHPLTLFFGAYITPHISSNLIGFLCGLIFVMGIALILYEIHLRIPLLKFLFSGKPPVKQESRAAIG
ncbi:glucans biosynthesis protein MdoC [Salmonella enterica subsp. enterica serovar Kentucky]|nr:glucans biosynthesis protein MdoC [Salmonella enterica subsp. enterica serovar Kentucky]